MLGPTDARGGARGADPRSEVRAQLTRATIFNRLARKADAAAQAAPALRRATELGFADLAGALRVELARAALDAGPPELAVALLEPVLDRPGGPLARAVALLVAAEALAAAEHPAAAADALAIATGLCRDSAGIDPDDGVLVRGAAAVVAARQHRHDGATAAAADGARAGVALLDTLADADRDSGEVRGQLVLEHVLALLDAGALDDATRAAAPLLDQPARAASAAPAAWTALAVATRVHVPRDDRERATGLLVDTVRVAERHRLDPVLVGCHDALVLLHEERGELADALAHLRAARAAEHRRRQAVDRVRAAVEDLVPPVAERAPVSERLAALLREQVAAARPPEPAVEPEPTPEPTPAEPEPPGPTRLYTEPPLASERLLASPDVDDPPPAPEMRRLDGGTAGIGDLLAEALAAFQEGRRRPPAAGGRDEGPPSVPGAVAPGAAPHTPPRVHGTAKDLWRPPPRSRPRRSGK